MKTRLNSFKNKSKFDMIVYDLLIENNDGKYYNVVNHLSNAYEYHKLKKTTNFKISECELSQAIVKDLFKYRDKEIGKIYRLDYIIKLYVNKYLQKTYNCTQLSQAMYSSSQTWEDYIKDKVDHYNDHEANYKFFVKEVMAEQSELNQFSRNVNLIGNIIPFKFLLNKENILNLEKYYEIKDEKILKGLVKSEEELRTLTIYLNCFSTMKDFIELNYLDFYNEGNYQWDNLKMEEMSLTELNLTLSNFNNFIIRRSEIMVTALIDISYNRNNLTEFSSEM